MTITINEEIPAFFKFGIRFGPYVATLQAEDNGDHRFYLKGGDGAVESKYGNLHPHADPGGNDSYLGSSWYPSYSRKEYWGESIHQGGIAAMKHVLHNAVLLAKEIKLYDQDAYCQVESWSEKMEQERDTRRLERFEADAVRGITRPPSPLSPLSCIEQIVEAMYPNGDAGCDLHSETIEIVAETLAEFGFGPHRD